MPRDGYQWRQPGEVHSEGRTYQEALISFIASKGSPDTQELDAPFSDRNVIRRVREFVRIAISDPRILSNIKNNSYIHKNGFRKVVLAKELGYALRFHFYLVDDGDENIHDHRWRKMHSLILNGKLTAEYFHAVENGGELYHRHIYSKTGNDIAYKVRYTGDTQRLAVVERVKHNSGEYYSMTSKEMHKIVASNEPVSTLVLTEPVPEERTWCNLYNKHVISEAHDKETNERKLTYAELQESLTQLEHYLSESLRNFDNTSPKQGVCY